MTKRSCGIVDSHWGVLCKISAIFGVKIPTKLPPRYVAILVDFTKFVEQPYLFPNLLKIGEEREGKYEIVPLESPDCAEM